MRIPHPVPLTQAILRTNGGKKLFAFALAVTVAHHLGVISVFPEPYPIECEARNVHELTAEERAELCP
jgi:hypothetical protein